MTSKVREIQVKSLAEQYTDTAGFPRTRIQGDHDIVDRHPEKALKFHTELIRIAAGCTWKQVFSLIPVESISTMQHPCATLNGRHSELPRHVYTVDIGYPRK